MAVILQCNCDHAFQDERYGKGNRVFNEGKGSLKCTVCGATKPLSSGGKK